MIGNKKTIIVSAIFVCIVLSNLNIYAQIHPNIGNWEFIYSWKEDVNSAYFYVHFDGEVPYVIVDDVRPVVNLQQLILGAEFGINKPTNREFLTLDKSSNPAQDASLLPDYYYINKGKTFEIKGSPEIYLSEIGFAPGDSLIMQQVTPEGSGEKIIITAKKYWFYTSNFHSIIIIECDTPEKQITAQWSIARSVKSAKAGTVSRTIDTAVPEIITNKVDELMKSYVPESYWDPEGDTMKFLGIQFWTYTSPVHITDNNGLEKTFFVGTVSYGYRWINGRIYLFDPEGNVIDMKEYPEGGGYGEIIGLTDLDSDGTHELVVRCGGPESGIELLELKYNENGQLKFETRLRFVTTES
ncbi:hypothetical protein ACFL7D_04285 [candidate division KSB1 bacterium]